MADTKVPLSIPPGLNSDDTTFAASGQWADGANCRFYNGKPQTIGAYDVAITVPGLGEVVTELGAFSLSSGSQSVLIGTRDALLVGTLYGSTTTITPAGLGIGHNSWSFAAYGDIILCSPYQGPIYEYTLGSGVTATVNATAPSQSNVVLVTRRQVLAFGTNEELSGTFNTRCIRGSAIEDPSDWTTSSTNTAFEDILDDEGGITAARVVGDYIAVWTSTSLWMGTYVGNPDQIYEWSKVAGGQGASGPNAACVDGSIVSWFAPDYQIWQWSPGAIPAPVPCLISKDFIGNLSDASLIRVVALPHFGETWLFYHDNRDFDAFATRYIAFNRAGQWFRGQLGRSAVCTSGITSQMIQSATGDATAAGAFLAASDSNVYAHEVSVDNVPSAQSPDWFLQSADQYLDEGGRRLMLKRLVPDFEDQAGTINLTLHMRDRPKSAAVTKGPYVIGTSDEKKDFRASGMIASAKFSGSTYARFGRPVFVASPMGQR
jgi:hypothetical protein